MKNSGQLPEIKDWINFMKTLFTITAGWLHPSGGASLSAYGGSPDRLFEFIRSGSKQPKAGQATGAPGYGLYPSHAFCGEYNWFKWFMVKY